MYYGSELAQYLITIIPSFRYKPVTNIGFIRVYLNWAYSFEPMSGGFWKQVIVFILDQYRCTVVADSRGAGSVIPPIYILVRCSKLLSVIHTRGREAVACGW